jgi:hypothetical protein
MARSERPRAEPNAGAFMGPDIMVPVPMGTLGEEPVTDDDPHDAPQEPRRRGWLERVLDRLTMRPRPRTRRS